MSRPEGASTVTPLRAALTARGKGVLGGSLAVLGAGVMLRYPELIGLGVTGIVAVLMAVATVARSPGLRVEREVAPGRVARGGRAVARVRVRNAGRRRSAAALARDLAGPGAVPFPLPKLRPGTAHEGEVELPTSRRGVVRSGPLLVDRFDPLGMAHRTLDTGRAADLLVRPRAVDVPEIGASLARSVDGPQSDTTMEGTLAFHALREYLPGDEPRHIHWRATAHAGKVLVKQHVDTAHAALAVVLDLGAAARPGPDPAAGPGPAGDAADAFEVAVDCAASVAVAAVTRRQPLLLVDSRGDSLLPGNSRRTVSHTTDDVLDSLTRVAPAAAGADLLPGALRRLAGAGRGSLAVVVSTRPLGPMAPSLQLLAGAYARVIAVHAVTAGLPPGSATRTGRVLWVTARRPEDLTPALIRARAAA